MKPAISIKEIKPSHRKVISDRVGKMNWTRRADASAEPFMAVLNNPDAFLADPNLYFKNSRNVTLALIPREGKTAWVLRRLNYGKRLHQFRDFFRASRAHRAFWNGLRLEQAGVATARVLAAGAVRRLGWPERAYLLTEEIHHAQTLHQLVNANRLSQTALLDLAQVLARLHESGFSHRDLKSSNVLFDSEDRAYLIDLDGVSHHRQIDEDRTVSDLARLARDFLSRPQVLKWSGSRFLRRYCQQRKQPEAWRRLALRIAAALGKIPSQV